VFENRVLRRKFGPRGRKWREAGEDCITRSFINCTLHHILLEATKLTMRWTGHFARIGEIRNAYKILVGKPEGKRPLGIPRRRWEHNIKIILGK
jgi:hypothetical protein